MKRTASSGTLAYTLFTLESNPSQRRFAFIIGAIIALASLASLPFAHITLPNNNAFLSALCSSVICFELITVFVLYSQFKVSRFPSILILAGGYFYSACMTILYLFSFPGILPPNGFGPGPIGPGPQPGMEHGPEPMFLIGGNQSAEYIYALWHLGFPIAILLHMAAEVKYKQVRLSNQTARLMTIITGTAVLAAVAVIGYVSLALHDKLPILMDHGRITPLAMYGFGLPTLLISLLALALYYFMTKGSTVTSSWLCVALLATVLDVGINMSGGNRFSIGWYVSKLDTFICANIVLAGMIYEFTKMYYKMTELYTQVTDSESRYKTLFAKSREGEQKIAEQNKIIERMLESSHESIAMCDSDGRVVFVNRRFKTMFGRELSVGQSLAIYCKEMRADYGSLGDQIKQYFEQRLQPFRERVAFHKEGGEMRHYECYVSPIISKDGGLLHGHLFTFGDRTDEERKAHYDDLTGLPNRRYINERLRIAMRRAAEAETSFAVFFMDLDGFKRVNDTLGHEMGDRLLQEVAILLKDGMGGYGTCARWAGDEFVVLVDEAVGDIRPEELALDLIRAIRQLDIVDGKRIQISASIGIAIYPDDTMDGTKLLQYADQAMYEAKTKGRGTFCFYTASAASSNKQHPEAGSAKRTI
ncbi:diguanylate cyclase domain-containing protein [Paenibacillus sp. BC26]|uniref:diguanylate cyclase domain-containing protein n=1 Tax=Paenibacillus sp. BC26 TaxID=1881032 RepID=UPI0008E6BEC2|nr:diguanylate cyclase [Paenibacillus sp. BC26]SFT24410.1 PAS domain S-box-containing protein/diguanylate cyclase (GGDEF) domain-containing protein [Paenibacillus sp. BC26]